MKKILLATAILTLTLGMEKLYGIGVEITGRELGLKFALEYNRTFLFCWDISAVGTLRLNNRHSVRGGIAPGSVGETFEVKWFAGGEVAPFASIPIYLGLDYKHNALPGYKYQSRSLRLLASFNQMRWGFSAGPTFRFSTFFEEYTVFEPILSFSAHVFFINNEFLCVGLRIANFSEFSSRTMAAHFLNFNTLIRLNERLSLVNEIHIHQSGSFALAANLYGLVYRGGLLFLW